MTSVPSGRLARLGSHLGGSGPTRAATASMVASGGGPLVHEPTGLLTAAQIETYCRDGFVLCSGLVSAPIAAAAEASLWQQMEGPPKSPEDDPWSKDDRPRPRRADRASWAGWAGIVDGPDIAAAFTPELIAAAKTLADAYEAASPFPSCVHRIAPPPQSLAINIFPSPDAAEPVGLANALAHCRSARPSLVSCWNTHCSWRARAQVCVCAEGYVCVCVCRGGSRPTSSALARPSGSGPGRTRTGPASSSNPGQCPANAGALLVLLHTPPTLAGDLMRIERGRQQEHYMQL